MGIWKDWKRDVQQDKERLPSPSVCGILYLVAVSNLAPSIVSLASRCLWRRKGGGYALLGKHFLKSSSCQFTDKGTLGKVTGSLTCGYTACLITSKSGLLQPSFAFYNQVWPFTSKSGRLQPNLSTIPNYHLPKKTCRRKNGFPRLF